MVIRHADFLKDIEKLKTVNREILRKVYACWTRGEIIDIGFKDWEMLILDKDRISSLLRSAINTLEKAKWSGIYTIIGGSGTGKSQICKLLQIEISNMGKGETLYFDLSKIILENLKGLVSREIERKSASGKPIIVILDHADIFMIEKRYERIFHEIYSLALSYSQKPIIFRDRLIPISFIFVFSTPIWLRIAEVQINDKKLSEHITILARLSLSISDFLRVSRELVRKFLALFYSITPSEELRQKMDKFFSIIAAFSLETSKYLVIEKKLFHLRRLITSLCNKIEFYIKNLEIEKPKISEKTVISRCKALLVEFLKSYKAFNTYPLEFEKTLSFTATYEPESMNQNNRLGTIKIVGKRNDNMLFEDFISLILESRASIESSDEKSSLLKMLEYGNVMLMSLYSSNEDIAYFKAIVKEIQGMKSNILITVPIYYEITKYVCLLEPSKGMELLDSILALSSLLDLSLFSKAFYLVGKSLVTGYKHIEDLQEPIYYGFFATLLFAKTIKRLAIDDLKQLIESYIISLLREAGLKITPSISDDLKDSMISRLERERFLERVGNYIKLNFGVIENVGIDTAAKKLAQEMIFRLKFIV